MTGLLLNEQSWLALLYFIVLPLLAVGIAVASVQRKDKRARRSGSAGLPEPIPPPVDPTPMAAEAPPERAHPVTSGDRILAITPTPVVDVGLVEDSGISDSEAVARLATTRARLEAAKARLEAQDRELDDARTELEAAREALTAGQETIHQLERQLEEHATQLETLRSAAAEAASLREQLEDLRAARTAHPLAEPEALDPAIELDDDGEIVVPMPASAAEEFDVDDDFEDTEEGEPTLRADRTPSDDHLLTPTVLDRLSMAFDGSTEPVVVEPSFTGLSHGGFTIEAWIRPATTRLPRTVLSYAVAGSSRVILTACGARPSLGVQLDGQALPDDLQPRLIADVWQHVGVSWDCEGGRLTVYLDGSLAFSGEVAPSARIPRGGRLILGQEPARGAQVLIPGRAYEGGLAEVRVWSHVRSPTEIQRDTHRRVPLQDGLRVWRVG